MHDATQKLSDARPRAFDAWLPSSVCYRGGIVGIGLADPVVSERGVSPWAVFISPVEYTDAITMPPTNNASNASAAHNERASYSDCMGA